MRPLLHFDLHDDGGVRQAQQLGQQDAGLADALIVALQAGEDQVEGFLAQRGGQGFRRAQRIEQEEFVVGDVDAAVGALGQRFLDGLLGALRAHGERHDLAAVLFLQAQGFFEREAVRLVHLEADVGFANPQAVIGDAQRRILGGNLLDADGDLSWLRLTQSCATLPALEEQRGIGAAEAEGIRERVFDVGLARVVGHVIEIASRVGMLVVDGRRQNLVAQGQHADAGFEAAGAAEQMAGHGLGGADGEASWRDRRRRA